MDGDSFADGVGSDDGGTHSGYISTDHIPDVGYISTDSGHFVTDHISDGGYIITEYVTECISDDTDLSADHGRPDSAKFVPFGSSDGADPAALHSVTDSADFVADSSADASVSGRLPVPGQPEGDHV